MGPSTIDSTTIVANILGGTNTSFATFAPLFVFLGGLLLALLLFTVLVQVFTGRKGVDSGLADDEGIWW